MPPANISTRATRQALTERNGGGDLPPSGPPSTAGSDCGPIEFTKESIEALLNERLKIKNKFNYKVSLSYTKCCFSLLFRFRIRLLCSCTYLLAEKNSRHKSVFM